MAYGYYQQSGMPGWGTNQAISSESYFILSPNLLFLSISSELRLLQVFSLNPLGEVLTSTVLMPRPPIRTFLITLGAVYVSMGVLLLVAWVLAFMKQDIGIVVPMGV
jgi:hypothetical protein